MASPEIDTRESEDQTPELDEHQQQEVERRLFIPALVVHEVVRKQGDEELKRPVSALAWSALAAGLSMGMSMVTEGLLEAYLPAASWRPLIVRFGYSVGFLMVIIGRQQLFTENTLTPILVLMANRSPKTLWNVLRLWSTVLCANLVGAHAVAWVLAGTNAFPRTIRAAFTHVAHEAVDVDFPTAVLRGVFAGWLIALMVWMLAAVRTGQIPIIIIMTYTVGLGGFTHIIAGSVEALFLVWSGQLSWWNCAGGYMLPALIGNVIGGVSLVAALNHAQVVAGSSPRNGR